ncbi:MAG: RHS repeat-associated core domain-containing protein, partial [Gemmatimonadaceae bacterium]
TGIRVTRYRYDTYGRGVATVDPEDRRDSVQYDLIGRTIASIDGLNRVTTYAYDSLYLRSITSARGQVTSFVRNALGWPTQENRPGSNPLYAFYDKNGNIDSTINRRGQVVKFTYDALDRLSSRLADGQNTTFGYENASSSAAGYSAGTNSEGTDTIYVNSAGRITNAATRRNSNWYRNTYTYDTHGRVSRLEMTSNKWSDYKAQYWGFSSSGALNSIYVYGQGNFSYTALNPGSGNEDIATTISYSNGVTLTRTLGSTHRALEHQYNSGLQSSFGVKIRLDESGRITQRGTAQGDTVRGFAYETGTGRLSALRKGISPGCDFDSELGYECWASATIVSQETFAYDAVGNQLTGVWQLDTVRNRILSTNQFTFIYDADGNLISKVGSGLSQTLEWNSLGQLTRVTTNNVITDFAYDAFGRRVRKTHSGTTTGFLWGGSSLLIELDNAGAAVTEYDYFGLDRPHSMRKGGQHYYYAQDPVAGNVRGLFRHSDAAVVARYSYQAFGQLESNNSVDSVGNALRFGAREYDSETGLYFNRARYYDAAIGRFISEDPIGLAGGINLYAYAGDDPVNFMDPMGLCIVAQSSSTTPPSSGFPTLASVSAEQPCASPTTPRMPRTANDDPITDDGPGEESGGGGSGEPDPTKPQSCSESKSETQFSVGGSALAGVGPFLGGFYGLGGSMGFTTNGRFFIQFQGLMTGGLGAFVGIGAEGTIARSSAITKTVTTGGGWMAQANGGLGPSAGGSVARSNDGHWGVTGPISLRGGLGLGLQAAVGVFGTVTIATPRFAIVQRLLGTCR